MTLKSLMNFGGFKDSYQPSIDRYHSDSGGYHHSGSGGYYGSRGSSKSKGASGAALSALTLLAFLFLINVMQQSMQDANAMTPATTMMTAIAVRDIDQPVIVDAKEGQDTKNRDEVKRDGRYGVAAKSKIQRLNSQYIK